MYSVLAVSVYQAWGKHSFSKKFVRAEYHWTFGQLLTVVNCWPDAIATRGAVLSETFVDTVHNLLFVHFNQNFSGLYHGMCCICNE